MDTCHSRRWSSGTLSFRAPRLHRLPLDSRCILWWVVGGVASAGGTSRGYFRRSGSVATRFRGDWGWEAHIRIEASHYWAWLVAGWRGIMVYGFGGLQCSMGLEGWSVAGCVQWVGRWWHRDRVEDPCGCCRRWESVIARVSEGQGGAAGVEGGTINLEPFGKNQYSARDTPLS
jgi:hypothetical protein